MRSFPYIFAEVENLFLNWPQFPNNIMMISYRMIGLNHINKYLIHNDILQFEE